MQQLNYSNYKIARALTFISAVTILIISYIMGKNNFFLLLNTDLGKAADVFFAFMTHWGEEFAWIGVFILFVIFRRKQLPLYLSTLAISTLIVQLIKNTIMHNEPRPTLAIADPTHTLIHTVEGIKLNMVNSFPSGHTTSAFSIYLMACLLIPKRWIIPIGFIYAVLVAYSRIYLAQHFPRDIGGGMAIALITIHLSLLIQNKFDARKKLK
jgi:membrane-associated phospholipid phosphatase